MMMGSSLTGGSLTGRSLTGGSLTGNSIHHFAQMSGEGTKKKIRPLKLKF
jgi:hypothetical protein